MNNETDDTEISMMTKISTEQLVTELVWGLSPDAIVDLIAAINDSMDNPVFTQRLVDTLTAGDESTPPVDNPNRTVPFTPGT